MSDDVGPVPGVRAADPVDGGDLPGVRESATLSDRALGLVDGARQERYGPPEESLRRIGQAWQAVLGLDRPIPGWRVALCMAALKLVRASGAMDEDSAVDAVAYVELAERLKPGPVGWSDIGLVPLVQYPGA